MEKTCKNCPFLRGNSWDGQADSKIRALQELDQQ
jgi:hypothetical protein